MGPTLATTGYDTSLPSAHGSLAIDWQQFERQFGDRIVDIFPPNRTIEFFAPKDNKLIGDRHHKFYYTDYEDAVQKIVAVLRVGR